MTWTNASHILTRLYACPRVADEVLATRASVGPTPYFSLAFTCESGFYYRHELHGGFADAAPLEFTYLERLCI